MMALFIGGIKDGEYIEIAPHLSSVSFSVPKQISPILPEKQPIKMWQGVDFEYKEIKYRRIELLSLSIFVENSLSMFDAIQLLLKQYKPINGE